MLQPWPGSWLTTVAGSQAPSGHQVGQLAGEDVKLIGLLIANIEGDAWAKMLRLINRGIPIDLFLEMAEEIKRSGREVPSAQFFDNWQSTDIQKQNCMLIASLAMKPEHIEMVRNAPPGGELFERIRQRSLDA